MTDGERNHSSSSTGSTPPVSRSTQHAGSNLPALALFPLPTLQFSAHGNARYDLHPDDGAGAYAGAVLDRQGDQGSCGALVSGRWHATRAAADRRRDRVLCSAGYRVLRVTADEVLHSLREVLARIAAAMGRAG